MSPRSAARGLLAALAAAVSAAAPAAGDPPAFLAFESGQVRPLALSPDGGKLLAVNTPDNRLEVFRSDGGGLEHAASVPVGMEPVAVAARSDSEAWVVNHLSDSVSVVDLGSAPPRVVRTLLVGDEPRDVVFAGPSRRRAFVTTARRGQHRTHPSLAGVPGAGDPRLTVPGTPRADVWVFDAEDLGSSLGGTPLRIVELFGDTPRALAVSPDGSTVYAAAFFSGNQTTTIPEQAVCDGFRLTDRPDACPGEFPGVPGGHPGPATNHAGVPAPEVGLIVRHDRPSGEWRDELGRDWSAAVRFDLADLDVFAIDAATLRQTAAYAHVGTVLFNMAVNPVSGKLYVSNTEARNEVRFEGAGAFGGSTVQGRLHETRVTVIDAGGAGEAAVEPRHLNKHLDYAVRPAPPSVKRHSLATPLDMAVSGDGETLYVAAFGSGTIGVFDTRRLEDDTFEPTAASARHIALSGGGPSGLALDEARRRLYVLTRFDNAVTAIDLASGEEADRAELHNPEPPSVVKGRRILYDAARTSSNGEASCASCHVFADVDGLAWDLGNPDGDVTRSPIPILREPEALDFHPPINGTGDPGDHHPMKGPMTTQTLRGLTGTGALHWRGDRSNGTFGVDPSSTELSMLNFAVAFPDLLGHRFELQRAQMKRFSDFILALVAPPNPVRRLDNSLTPRQQAGKDFFESRSVGTGEASRRCQSCHVLAPRNGNFGTAGLQSFSMETQVFKVPQLRTVYQKVGMFGGAETELAKPPSGDHMGAQVRGFGFLHDGSVDTVFHFLRGAFFRDGESPEGFRNDRERRDVEQYLLAFDSDLAPAVGQQVTQTSANVAEARERIDLLIERSAAFFHSRVLGGVATECELIVKGTVEGVARGGLYSPVTRRFRTDRAGEPGWTAAQLRRLARRPGGELTFTCVPPGSGRRLGIDRDLDGFLDRDEIDAASDPADPESVPPPDPTRYNGTGTGP